MPVIFCEDERSLDKSKALSEKLSLPLVKQVPAGGLFLVYRGDRLSISDGTLSLCGDFRKMLPRIRKENLHHEMLVRTAKLKNRSADDPNPPMAIDATAGLGEDSLLLAAAGFSVRMYEHNPILAALLADAMRRAEEIPELQETVSRMTLFEEDSLPVLQKLSKKNSGKKKTTAEEGDGPEYPDVVLLDPMFPERQKSALVRKKLQLIQKLESPEGNGEALLKAAQKAGPRKVIVKRPVKGPFLCSQKPSYSIKGKAIRYDCYVNSDFLNLHRL